MTRRNIIFAAVGLLTSILLVFLYHVKTVEIELDQIEVNDSMKERIERPTATKKKDKDALTNDAQKLSEFLKSVSSLKNNESNELDEEQQKLLEDKTQAIADRYWEEAPRTLDKMLKEQERDTKWTYDTRAEAELVLGSNQYEGTQLDDIDCGQTLCKMKLSHEDLAARDILVASDFTQKGSWDGDQYGYTSQDENDKYYSTIFFTRKGDYYPFIELRERIAMIAGYEPNEEFSHLKQDQQSGLQ